MGQEDLSTTKRDARLATAAKRKERERRDGIGFVALPHVVIESAGYRSSGHTARSLLVDLTRAFNGKNNGAIWLSRSAREAIGWGSESTYRAALADLIACGLLVETRKGGRNLAAWYGLTWRDLDVTHGLDIDPKQWRRGAYLQSEKVKADGGKARTVKATTARSVSAGLRACYKPAPSHGATPPPIEPYDGATPLTSCTVARCIQPEFGDSVAPSHGEYLEGCHLGERRAAGGVLPAAGLLAERRLSRVVA